MSINILHLSPAGADASKLLRVEPYPSGFTLADRTRDRMSRARAGLVHIMTEFLPGIEQEQSEAIHYWLDAVLSIVDITKIDAEGQL